MQDMWANMRERASALMGNISTELERQRHMNAVEEEIARLRGEIEAATTDLGRLVLKLEREGRLAPDPLLPPCRAIATMEAQLRLQEEMLEDLRTAPLAPTQTCIQCGAPLEADADFCIQCGAPQGMPAAGATCAACGAVLEEDALFCGHCGAPVAAAPPPQETALPESEVVPPVETNCAVCGAVLEADAIFCGNCGAPVEAKAEVIDAAPAAVPAESAAEVEDDAATEAGVEAPPVEAAMPLPDLEAPAESAAEVEDDAAVEAGVEMAPAPVAHCIQCGVVLPAGEAFCPGCGWVIEWDAIAENGPSPDEEATAGDVAPGTTGDEDVTGPAEVASAVPPPIIKQAVDAEETTLERYCPSCEQRLRPRARFCPTCGSDVSNVVAQPPPRARIHCGVILDAEMRFCPECGAEVSEAPAVDPHCLDCGSLLRPGASFCPVCGRPVSDLLHSG